MKAHALLFKILSTFILSGLCAYTAFSQDTTPLGKISDLNKNLKSIQAKKGRASKVNVFSFRHEGVTEEIVLDKLVESTEEIKYFGHDKNNKNRSFYLSVMGDNVEGTLLDNEMDEVVTFSSDGSDVIAVNKDIDEVLCVHYEYIQADVENELLKRRERLDDSPSWNKLESLPGVNAVVYLDFDGETVTTSGWNSGNTINAVSQNYSADNIKKIWKEVSEDFMPFTVNVTTDRSVYNNAPQDSRMMCIFTDSWQWYKSTRIGGVAKLGSFDNNRNDPCWVFNKGTRVGAITASHEIGHTLNLRHDGRVASGTSEAETYYRGHNNWGTLMGGATTRDVAQWSKGEYARANNTEDDLAIIISNKNINYKTDDHSNSRTGATNIVAETNGTIQEAKNDGVIERNNDKDYFKFVTGAGQVVIRVNPATYATNLNIKARLLNSSGGQVDFSDPSNSYGTSMTNTLAAGTYYIEVDGVGDGASATVGFSGYGSLGYYSISGSLIANVPKDCNGVAGGSAFNDGCGVCVRGNTGKYPCANLADGEYTIKNVHSQKCIFTNPKGRQKTCNSSNPDEVWTLKKQGNFYSMVNFGTENALELPSTNNLTGTEATTQFNNSDKQLFRLEQRTEGQIKIVPKADLSKGIAISGLNTDENRPLVVWNLIDDNNYKFVFTKVENASKDCNNTFKGTAYQDYCNECVGGLTGKEACQVPYATQTIPGTVELEFYDHGGQNVSFYDDSEENFGVFRLGNSVDIDGFGNDEFALGWNRVDEWTEYTLDATETAMYDMEAVIASPNGEGQFHLELDGVLLGNTMTVTNTGEWNVYESMNLGTEQIEAGEHVLRFYVDNAGLNADKLIFTKEVISSTLSKETQSISVYPTPNSSGVFLTSVDSDWEVLNLHGQSILTGNGEKINLKGYENGVYLVRIQGKVQKIVLEK